MLIGLWATHAMYDHVTIIYWKNGFNNEIWCLYVVTLSIWYLTLSQSTKKIRDAQYSSASRPLFISNTAFNYFTSAASQTEAEFLT